MFINPYHSDPRGFLKSKKVKLNGNWGRLKAFRSRGIPCSINGIYLETWDTYYQYKNLIIWTRKYDSRKIYIIELIDKNRFEKLLDGIKVFFNLEYDLVKMEDF